MNVFDRFLLEAFPPKKPPTKGAGAPLPPKKPVVGAGAPGLPAQKGTATPPPSATPPPVGAGAQKPPEPAQGDGTFSREGDDSVLATMQMKAQQDAEEEAKALQQQQDEKDEQERQQAKQLRVAAEAEVSDALADKYNDGEDTVTFYPSMDTFGDWSKNNKDAGGDEEDEEESDDDTDDEHEHENEDEDGIDAEGDEGKKSFNPKDVEDHADAVEDDFTQDPDHELDDDDEDSDDDNPEHDEVAGEDDDDEVSSEPEAEKKKEMGTLKKKIKPKV